MNEKSQQTLAQSNLESQEGRFYQNPVVKKIDDLVFKFKVSRNKKYALLFIVPFTLLVLLLIVKVVKDEKEQKEAKVTPTPTVSVKTVPGRELPQRELTEPEKLLFEIESFDEEQKDLLLPVLDWKFRI